MKIIKVCGRIACNSIYQKTGIAMFSCMLCSCAPTAKIPYKQTLYKMTYEYLRTAECQNKQDNQTAYIACDRSYKQDFAEYRKIRETLVNAKINSETAIAISPLQASN